MKTNKQKVVIVGGGFAGVKTARELEKDRKFKVTLISDSQEFRYYPSLYHTATGGVSDVSSIPLTELIDASLINIVKAKVSRIDRAQKKVISNDGQEFAYDYLVLAMGVVTNFFNIPGLEKRAYGIKSLEDAEKLKQHLHKQIVDERRPDMNYVIVGGGPTGIELAGVLGDYVKKICDKHGVKRRKIHVDLVEASPRLVSRMPRDVSLMLARQLRRKGVKIYLNARVEGQNADELMVNGKPIRSHTVIWTAGMANNPFFAKQGFQLAGNGKVRVNQFLQAEPCIFVLGDNADTPYSGMAQTAIHDGAYMARSLVSIVRYKRTPEPYIAKKPVYVMPAGPNWAAVVWGRFRIYGRAGWMLRRAADFIGYLDYEPFFKATQHWLDEYEKEELCPTCQPGTAGLSGW